MSKNCFDYDEIKLLMRIDNPYILEFKDSFLYELNYFLVTEYCEV